MVGRPPFPHTLLPSVGIRSGSDWRQNLLITGLSQGDSGGQELRRKEGLEKWLTYLDSLPKGFPWERKSRINASGRLVGRKSYSAILLTNFWTQFHFFHHSRFPRYTWVSFYLQPHCSGFKHWLQKWIFLSQSEWDTMTMLPKLLVG